MDAIVETAIPQPSGQPQRHHVAEGSLAALMLTAPGRVPAISCSSMSHLLCGNRPFATCPNQPCCGGLQMSPDPLLQRRGMGLYPAEQGRTADHHAAIRQHRGQVAVADRERQIPPQRPQDHLGREVPPLERAVLSRRHRTHPPSRLMTFHPISARPDACNRTRASITRLPHSAAPSRSHGSGQSGENRSQSATRAQVS